MVTEEELPNWLIERIPALEEIYESDELRWRTQRPPISSYFMFSFVLRRHFDRLVSESNDAELRRILDLMEYLAEEGDASVKNELRVVTEEEMTLWPFWVFLGKTMRQNHVVELLSFPQWRDRETRMNTYVDEDQYRRRWFEEIEKIGGFEKLTDELHVSIRNRLGAEFDIEAAYVPRKP